MISCQKRWNYSNVVWGIKSLIRAVGETGSTVLLAVESAETEPTGPSLHAFKCTYDGRVGSFRALLSGSTRDWRFSGLEDGVVI